MTLLHEWIIEDINSTDGASPNLWPPHTGPARPLVSPGTYEGIYKTNITPSGKAVMRFNGTHSYIGINSGLTGYMHVFIVAACQQATPIKNQVLYNGSGGLINSGINQVIASDFDTIAGVTVRRDGVDTRSIAFGGQFCIYEFITTGVGSTIFLFCTWNNAFFGKWDVCYAACYDVELTGAPLTALRANLASRYITPANIGGSSASIMRRKKRSPLFRVG